MFTLLPPEWCAILGVEGVDRFMVPPGRMLLSARSSMSLLDRIDRSEPRIEPPKREERGRPMHHAIR